MNSIEDELYEFLAPFKTGRIYKVDRSVYTYVCIELGQQPVRCKLNSCTYVLNEEFKLNGIQWHVNDFNAWLLRSFFNDRLRSWLIKYFKHVKRMLWLKTILFNIKLGSKVFLIPC